MKNTSRWVVAAFAAFAAAGCGKGSGGEHGNTTDTTAAPPPVTAATATAHKGHEPKAPKEAPTEAPKEAPAPGAAAADGYHWETHKGTNMKFELPTGWTTTNEGDVLVAKSTGVGLEFVGATSALAAKNDEKAMMAEVGKILQNVKLTSKMKPVEQHGAKGFVVTGTGKKDGALVEWFSSAIGGKSGALLTLGFYSPTIAPAVKAQIVHVMDSIGPAT